MDMEGLLLGPMSVALVALMLAAAAFDVRSRRIPNALTISGFAVAIALRFTAGPEAGIDGFRLDSDGRIWTSAEDGVHCYLADGTLIGKVLVPEGVANVCFGGSKRNVLFICGTTSLYCIRLLVNGAKTY